MAISRAEHNLYAPGASQSVERSSWRTNLAPIKTSTYVIHEVDAEISMYS